jgi:hypothetical protein
MKQRAFWKKPAFRKASRSIFRPPVWIPEAA